MNRKPLRIGSVLLSFVLLISCMTGCLPKGEQGDASVSQVETVPPESTAPAEPDYITRGMWIESLVKAVAGDDFNPQKAAELEPYFSDVDESHALYGFVQSAAMIGWLDVDIENGAFEPDAPANRGFVASTAVQAAGYMMVDGEDEPSEEILQTADPLNLLFAKRLGVITEDENGSLRAQETVDEAMCASVLDWYASVNTWDEGLPDVTEFNPGVTDLLETELAYTLDAENILRLPADYPAEPAVGDILLLPATAEWPDGTTVKISGGDAETGYTCETPAFEEIFSSFSMSMQQELDVEGPARLTDNGSDAPVEDDGGTAPAPDDESELSEADGGGEAQRAKAFSNSVLFTNTQSDDSSGGDDELPLPEGTVEDGIEVRRDDEGRLWRDMHWDYAKSFRICSDLVLNVNKIDLRVSIRYGEPFRNAAVPVPQRLKDMTYALEIRSILSFDFALSMELFGGEISETFEKDFLEDIMRKLKNPFVKVNATMTLEAKAKGEGAVGIPLSGRVQFCLNELSIQNPLTATLDKSEVRINGTAEASLAFTFDLGVSILGFKFVSNTLTSDFTAAAVHQDDGYGACMGIDATIATQYVVDLGSKLVGGVLDKIIKGIEKLMRRLDFLQLFDLWDSEAFMELKRFRDCMVNGFKVAIPEKPATMTVGRLHWEGEDDSSLRRTPNDVCTREFTLVLVNPTNLAVDESAALSILAKPKSGAARAGLTGRLRVENVSPDILSLNDMTVTGLMDGIATLQLNWVFSDEEGEWDSLLKGDVTVTVGEYEPFTVTLVHESHGQGAPCRAELVLNGVVPISGTCHYAIIRHVFYGEVYGNEPERTDFYEGTHVEAGTRFNNVVIANDEIDYGNFAPLRHALDYEFTFTPDDPNASLEGIPIHTPGSSEENLPEAASQ